MPNEEPETHQQSKQISLEYCFALKGFGNTLEVPNNENNRKKINIVFVCIFSHNVNPNLKVFVNQAYHKN